MMREESPALFERLQACFFLSSKHRLFYVIDATMHRQHSYCFGWQVMIKRGFVSRPRDCLAHEGERSPPVFRCTSNDVI